MRRERTKERNNSKSKESMRDHVGHGVAVMVTLWYSDSDTTHPSQDHCFVATLDKKLVAEGVEKPPIGWDVSHVQGRTARNAPPMVMRV